jgi:GT2 family glycosyltransferase/glycosyltransferase involved in cell wall biosynthesis
LSRDDFAVISPQGSSTGDDLHPRPIRPAFAAAAYRTLFIEKHYLLRNKDIAHAKQQNASFDPFQHFVDHGLLEGRSPSLNFDLNFVRHKLARYHDIKIAPHETVSAFFDLAPSDRFIPNTWFSPWAFRHLHEETHREIAGLSDYDLFEYYLANVREHGLSPNGLFNEKAYRARYQDIAESIERSRLTSGFEHFVLLGCLEGRINLPRFNNQAFAADHPGRNERDYVLVHQQSDLVPALPWFNGSFYLTIYSEVEELKRCEIIRSGLEHFMVLGFREKKLPHPAALEDMADPPNDCAWTFFSQYKKSPPPRIKLEDGSKLLKCVQDQNPQQNLSRLADAVWKFIEPPNVAARFDDFAYLAVNTDVAEALSGFPPDSAYKHWRDCGLREQRVAPGTDVFGKRAVSRNDFLGRPSGVNFFGPLSASNGLGSAARGFAAALRSAGVAVDAIDVSRLVDPALPLDLVAPSDLAYPVNFFFLNADMVLPFVDRFGTAFFDHHANVLCCVWELPSPRPEWRAALSGFDLIVTPSEYCRASFAGITNCPVAICPYVVDEASLSEARAKSGDNAAFRRIEAAKAAGKRIVLFIMDASSYVARKGLDVFLAMTERLEDERPGQFLFVLKSHSRDHSNASYRISNPHVLTINERFKFHDLVKLKSLVDVYVSPHRSEGFGLNIYESLVLGVPALCSDYGGGVDMLPSDYPYRITGRLIELDQHMGPYRQHAVWFEPSVKAACDALLKMLDDDVVSARFARIAENVRNELSLPSVGARLRLLLEQHCGLNAEKTGTAPAQLPFLSMPVRRECFTIGLPPGLERTEQAERLRQTASACLSPIFTIVTPTFNTPPDYLNEIYQDLVAQSYPGWEWSICDDGSTRLETLAILRELKCRDARIRVTLLPENRGISAATNAAVEASAGQYILMVDHDDRLHRDLLAQYIDAIHRDGKADIFYCDEDKLAADGSHCEPFYKPDWSPEHLMSTMYVLHCLCVRKRVFLELNGYRSAFDGAQDHDFVLRAAAAGARVRHIDRLLYHWRKAPDSASARQDAKPFGIEAGLRAVAEHLAALDVNGTVEHGLIPGTYRVRPVIPPGRVSLNILTACTPIRGQQQSYVDRFVRSLLEHECEQDFEIRVVVDEHCAESAAPLGNLDPRVRLVPFHRKSAFSFAEKANFAISTSECDRVVLLNDDMEALGPDWLPALLEMLEAPGVGVVGGRLLHDDETVQHSGIVLGVLGPAAHIFESLRREYIGPHAFTHVIRNYSAVTGALMAMRRSTFDLVGGFDPDYPIDYNDVDFCLRVIEAGLRVVFTPFAELKHFESRSAKRLMRDELDTRRFEDRWSAIIRRDPYYNSNLSRNSVMGEPATPA